MGQVLHRGAITTEAVRRAIQHSQESLRILARRLQPGPPAQRVGYLISEESRTGHANVDCKERFPHSHSLDYCCEINLRLNSNTSALNTAG